jgi:hypothetical protein
VALLAIVTVANTTVTFVSDTFKIHRVSIWSPPASQGASATCEIEWSSSDNNRGSVEISDTSMSTAEPAHVSGVPPQGCLASFWTSSVQTSSLFDITCPAGSIIDIDVTHVLCDGIVGDQQGISTGALGTFFYMPLNATVETLNPVSLTTTT